MHAAPRRTPLLRQPTISRHRKVLRAAGPLDGDRRGTRVRYRVVPDRLARLAAVLGPVPT